MNRTWQKSWSKEFIWANPVRMARTGRPVAHQGPSKGDSAATGLFIHLPVQRGCLLWRIGRHNPGGLHISAPHQSVPEGKWQSTRSHALEGGYQGVLGDGSFDALPSKLEIARISVVRFRYEEDTNLMVPIWGTKLKNQSDDEVVSTTWEHNHPLLPTAHDTIIHTRDVMSAHFRVIRGFDIRWVNYWTSSQNPHHQHHRHQCPLISRGPQS